MGEIWRAYLVELECPVGRVDGADDGVDAVQLQLAPEITIKTMDFS